MLKLVIVEDENNIRDCLVNLFPWNDLDVTVTASFSNGQDAYKYLCSNPADILLSDIRLPGMSGLDLIRLLREARNPIAAIILTAFRHFDYAQQAIRYGVNDFLLKPVKYNELTESILKIKECIVNTAEPEENVEEDQTYYEKLVATAKKYVTEHLADVTLESASLSVSLSTGYFSRLFHKLTGKTFSDYVAGCRMQKAAQQLKNIDYKMYEVSLMVGYDNPKNFTRAFKQYYGMTPRQYRETSSNVCKTARNQGSNTAMNELEDATNET